MLTHCDASSDLHAHGHQHSITSSPCLARIPNSGPSKVRLCTMVAYLNNVIRDTILLRFLCECWYELCDDFTMEHFS